MRCQNIRLTDHASWPSASAKSVPVISYIRTLVAKEDDAPQEGREPQARVLIGLVLADHDGVRHGQQAHLEQDTTADCQTHARHRQKTVAYGSIHVREWWT